MRTALFFVVFEGDFVGEDLADRRGDDFRIVIVGFPFTGYGYLIRATDRGAGKRVDIFIITDQKIERYDHHFNS